MIQKGIEEVEEIFNENIYKLLIEYDIQLIYVFGSYAKGNNNHKSDLDIAILIEDFNPLDKLNLIGDLIDMFKRNDIDLVILNTANSVLKHQVIKYGKLLYMKSEDIKVNFEVRVLSEYMDMEHFRKTQMKYVNKWVQNNLGGDKSND